MLTSNLGGLRLARSSSSLAVSRVNTNALASANDDLIDSDDFDLEDENQDNGQTTI